MEHRTDRERSTSQRSTEARFESDMRFLDRTVRGVKVLVSGPCGRRTVSLTESELPIWLPIAHMVSTGTPQPSPALRAAPDEPF